MALGRVKTWVAGEILTAADLNAEYNNILNNPVSLISPTTGAVDFNLQGHTNFRLQNVVAAPVASTAAIGRVVFNTASSVVQVDMGTAYLTIGPSTSTGGGGAATGASRVMAFTGIYTSSAKLTFSALQYILRTSSTSAPTTVHVISTSDKIVEVNTLFQTAGGTDTTSGLVAGGPVHYYAISTGEASTCQGLVSNAPPHVGPRLPSSAGYSHWAYLGSIPELGTTAGAISPMFQSGNLCLFKGPMSGSFSANGRILSSGFSTAGVVTNNLIGSMISSEKIPVVGVVGSMELRIVDTSTVSGTRQQAGLFPSTSMTFHQDNTHHLLNVFTPGTTGEVISNQRFEMPLYGSTSPAIHYALFPALPATSTGGLSLYIHGYRVANGDN